MIGITHAMADETATRYTPTEHVMIPLIKFPTRRSRMRMLSFILLLVLVILSIAFALLNAEPITINYFVGELTLPLSLLLFASLILGCVLSLLAQFKILLQYRYHIHALNKKLSISNKEINHLRVLPVRDVDP